MNPPISPTGVLPGSPQVPAPPNPRFLHLSCRPKQPYLTRPQAPFMFLSLAVKSSEVILRVLPMDPFTGNSLR